MVWQRHRRVRGSYSSTFFKHSQIFTHQEAAELCSGNAPTQRQSCTATKWLPWFSLSGTVKVRATAVNLLRLQQTPDVSRSLFPRLFISPSASSNPKEAKLRSIDELLYLMQTSTFPSHARRVMFRNPLGEWTTRPERNPGLTVPKKTARSGSSLIRSPSCIGGPQL